MEKKIDIYTSTGIKFWKHPKQMNEYKYNRGDTVISTHVSPVPFCNLNCSYCSVSNRDKFGPQLSRDVIVDYILKLKSYGLKAVIFTGGGEPTLYDYFDWIVNWISEQGLKLGLITNGTTDIDKKVLDKFTWIRISINDFPNWETRINIPDINGTLGFSLIYVGQDISFFHKVSKLADKLGAKYIRVLPNCLLDDKELLESHNEIKVILSDLKDQRFFHQFKIHETPKIKVCHQSHFRPYLSEVDGGTVYPCDSLVLNDKLACFDKKYAICRAENILNFLNRYVINRFDPTTDCSGCVFVNNNRLLDDWYHGRIDEFNTYENKEIEHAEFV